MKHFEMERAHPEEPGLCPILKTRQPPDPESNQPGSKDPGQAAFKSALATVQVRHA